MIATAPRISPKGAGVETPVREPETTPVITPDKEPTLPGIPKEDPGIRPHPLTPPQLDPDEERKPKG